MAGPQSPRYVPDAAEHVSPTASAAAAAAGTGGGWDVDERVVKQEQGERLFPFVCAHTQHRDAEIITGMLLEMPISQVEALITDVDSLAQHIAECQASLAKRREEDLARFVHEIAAVAAEAGGGDRGPVLDEVRALVDAWALDTTRELGLADERSPVHLYVYGSYLLGVAGPDSDIDVLIAVPAHICRVRHFFGLHAGGQSNESAGVESLLERLRRDKRVTDLVAVPDAFVPCIKLHFTGVDVDLTFANLGAPSLPQQPANRASWAGDIDSLTNAILADLAEDAPSLRSLNGVRATHALLRVVPDINTFRKTLRMVKTWARIRGVYGNQLGFFGGISWAILTAKICQDFPSSSAEHTLALFFRVYVSWQWPAPVRLRGVLLPGMGGGPKQSPILDDMVWNPETNPDDLRHHMPIITPVYPCMNSTFNTAPSNFRVIKSELDRAALIASPTLAGGVVSTPTLQQSGRAFFFSRYEWYLRLDIVASDAESQKKWVGLVQALLRHLIRSLESTRLFLVHPWPEWMDRELLDPAQTHAEKARQGNGNARTSQAAYFLGLVTEDASSLTVPISDAVAEFRRMVTMRAGGWHSNGMDISERIVRI
jgi:poly(A) polymerase